MKRLLLLFVLLPFFDVDAQYFEKLEIFSGDYLEPYDFKVHNGEMYFVGESDEVNSAIYRSSGVAGEGDILRNADGLALDGNAILGSFMGKMWLYCKVSNDEGDEIWSTDGTPEGTTKLKEINPNGASPEGDSNTRFMMEINGELIFPANDGINGIELWKSDGTEEGTVSFVDLNPGNGDGYISAITTMNNILYFIGDNGSDGRELWRTDGTADGTFMVKDINSEGDGAIAFGSIVFNDHLYFVGETAEFGRELWRTDGTESGTVQVIDMLEGVGDGLIAPWYLIFNDRLFFTAINDTYGAELWSTDGTEEGTELFIDLLPGNAWASTRSLVAKGDHFYFTAAASLEVGEPRRLFISDGTPEGTVQLAPELDIRNPSDLTVVNDMLLFESADENSNALLWSSDGTDEGTQVIAPEGLEDVWELQNWGQTFVFGDRFYFEAILNDVADLWSYGDDLVNIESPAISEKELEVFPNPNKGDFRLKADSPMTAYQIFSLDGKLIQNDLITSRLETRVNLEDAISGLYLIEIHFEDGTTATERIIIE